MDNFLISVIIPNYNHARYLDERIQTVLNQTYQNFELIILDDCSTDNSKEIIEKYRQNPHVSHILYNEQNSGKIFSQWQKGIDNAKGELIWIAESDDKCCPELLEKLVLEFQKNENLVVSFCKTVFFSDNGYEEFTHTIDAEKKSHFTNVEFVSQYMSRGCPMLNASACLFKKETAKGIDNLYMDFKGAGDRLFWTLMCECGDVAVVNEYLNYMRQHPNNSTKRNFQTGINQKEDKIILDYIYNKHYISKKEYDEIRKRYWKPYIYQYVTDKQLKKELYKLWGCGPLQILLLKLKNNRFTALFK